jgi:hypothetical protein
MEAVMATTDSEKTLIERIYDHGVAEGKAKVMIKLLDARGLTPTDAQRRQVTSAIDLAQLDLWFDRAITASTAAEVFGG